MSYEYDIGAKSFWLELKFMVDCVNHSTMMSTFVFKEKKCLTANL